MKRKLLIADHTEEIISWLTKNESPVREHKTKNKGPVKERKEVQL